MRVDLEKVGGAWQGACLFREGSSGSRPRGEPIHRDPPLTRGGLAARRPLRCDAAGLGHASSGRALHRLAARIKTGWLGGAPAPVRFAESPGRDSDAWRDRYAGLDSGIAYPLQSRRPQFFRTAAHRGITSGLSPLGVGLPPPPSWRLRSLRVRRGDRFRTGLSHQHPGGLPGVRCPPRGFPGDSWRATPDPTCRHHGDFGGLERAMVRSRILSVSPPRHRFS